jgi:hypothetical protein
MERLMDPDTTLSLWKSDVLPLYYRRKQSRADISVKRGQADAGFKPY